MVGLATWCTRGLIQCLARNGIHLSGMFKQSNPEVGDDAMCCCVPIRTAVFFNASFTVILSFLMITCKQWIEDEMRPLQGGYARSSRVLIEFIEVTGLCWGMLGVIGTVTMKSSYISTYLQYQIGRICATFYMYCTDVPLLWECEEWRTDLYGSIGKHGWNPVMYKIAMANRCYQERWQFIICSTLYLITLIYFASVNRRLQNGCEIEPKYKLNIPKMAPDGAFYSYGSGSTRAQEPKKRDPQPFHPSAGPPTGPPGMMGHPGMMGMHPGMGPQPAMMHPAMMHPGMVGPPVTAQGMGPMQTQMPPAY